MLVHIQMNYNNSLQTKLSHKVEELISYQKPMKITYLIIKRIELDQLNEGVPADNMK